MVQYAVTPSPCHRCAARRRNAYPDALRLLLQMSPAYLHLKLESLHE